ncbi:MAG: hypothetical protein WD294_14705 [Phycisphaeraceae bacterium]
MRTTATLILTLGLTTTLFIGCTDSAAPTQAPVAEHDESDHGHGDEQANGHEADGHHAGPKHPLGPVSVGPYTVTAKQIGEIEAGEPQTFEIMLDDPTTEPEALRAWVGNEQAVGSVKVRTVFRDGFYDADLQVPQPMPENSKLWVEIETDTERHVGSLELHE